MVMCHLKLLCCMCIMMGLRLEPEVRQFLHGHVSPKVALLYVYNDGPLRLNARLDWNGLNGPCRNYPALPLALVSGIKVSPGTPILGGEATRPPPPRAGPQKFTKNLSTCFGGTPAVRSSMLFHITRYSKLLRTPIT